MRHPLTLGPTITAMSDPLPAEPSSAQPLGWRLVVGIALLLLGLTALSVRSAGIVGERPEPIFNMSRWTLAQAAAYTGPPTGPVRLDGALSASDPVTMPDTGELALRGLITITLRVRSDADARSAVGVPVYVWDEAASDLTLYDGELGLPLDASPLDLPLFYDVDPQAELVEEGGEAVAVSYRGQTFPIEERWRKGATEVVVRRAWVPPRLKVAVLCDVDGSGAMPRLVPMPTGDVDVIERPPEGIPEQRRTLGAMAVVLGLASMASGAYIVRGGLRPGSSWSV